MPRAERRIHRRWGVFQIKERGTIVELDVVPSRNGYMAGDHIFGEACPCRPYRERHPQNIPLFVHHCLAGCCTESTK